MSNTVAYDCSIELMKRLIGMTPESVGRASYIRAIDGRRQALGIQNAENYHELLKNSSEEQDNLIEELIIPESWFLRESKPLELALRELKNLSPAHRKIRILSIPCARGEEPYSVSAIACEVGLTPDSFDIVGADISELALNAANAGVYQMYSLRGCSSLFIESNFDLISNKHYKIKERIKNPVKFIRANAKSEQLVELGAFDLVICRNLLIYLSAEDQKALISRLLKILLPDGLLVVGSAENAIIDRTKLQLLSSDSTSVYRLKAANTIFDTPKKAHKPLARGRAPQSVIRERSVTQKLIAESSAELGIKNVENLANSGQLCEARELCLELLRQHHMETHLYFLLGIVSGAIGEKNDAEANLRRAIYLNPDNPEAILALAYLCQDKKEAARLKRRAARLERRGSN
jgi:chemotaxis protein methyltransferase WspC